MRERLLIFLTGLFLTTAAAAPATAQMSKAEMKQKRDQLLPRFDAEVAQLVPLVKDVALRAPCPATKPGRPLQYGIGRNGPPYCVQLLQPHKERLTQLMNELNPVIDDDKRAGWIRSYWLTYVTSLETEMKFLADMKAKHQ